jgi:hypothetical protein
MVTLLLNLGTPAVAAEDSALKELSIGDWQHKKLDADNVVRLHCRHSVVTVFLLLLFLPLTTLWKRNVDSVVLMFSLSTFKTVKLYTAAPHRIA